MGSEQALGGSGRTETGTETETEMEMETGTVEEIEFDEVLCLRFTS